MSSVSSNSSPLGRLPLNPESQMLTIDGNEAVAYVAYRINEVCAIYPITPSSTMAELADQWSGEQVKNIWNEIPVIIEMQSEGGAAGALHGALQTGGLTTTFTASQGLLLMIPNMYKIAGELTPTVIHVAARALAAQGLSIFGDHSDVAAARTTGFAQLCSSSVQEAHDMALISQAIALESRIPFLHFFDGFRTSHEVSKIEMLSEATLRTMINEERVIEHRARALNPDAPVLRGTAQNPDVYFQGRETVNSFYDRLPAIAAEQFHRFGELTGRKYDLFEYYGHPQAERVIVVMGSAAQTVQETVDYLMGQGAKVGVIKVRLVLPFSVEHFLNVLPETCQSLAVLDRTKAPGSLGEPLYTDVLTALTQHLAGDAKPGEGTQAPDRFRAPALAPALLSRVIGGRYGLSSKEFTPAMVVAIYEELQKEQPKRRFTIGIVDDVTHLSLNYDSQFQIESDDVVRAVFYGLGADGTVGANKNSIKIIGESTFLFTQGYFVYDSKKSGSQTVSHLRFGHKPILSQYLIGSANFIGVHQFNFIYRDPVLATAARGAIFLLNSPHGPDSVWNFLPPNLQQEIIDRELQFYVIDASKVARATGMGNRTNTIMQTCFFALSGVLPREEAIEKIKYFTRKTYIKKGEDVVRKNFEAIDQTLASLYRVDVPTAANVSGCDLPKQALFDGAPEFVKNVTSAMLRGRGDALPVSALPVDGTYPTGTTKWEKRNIADSLPDWDSQSCIQCGNCAFVCPHSVIRAKFYHESQLVNAPEDFKSAPINARGFPATRYTLQIYPEDCTGCSLCVEACPVELAPTADLTVPPVKAINMRPKDEILERDKMNLSFFEKLPMNERGRVDFSSVRGTQFLEPLFEFSGACAGCGETPYLKLLSQLFGDRLLVANATGCSSIYGGNLPTTPWTKNKEGRGPAWANSLFEDNAEFGLGFRLATDQHLSLAKNLVNDLRSLIDSDTLCDEILNSTQASEADIRGQRERVGLLKKILLKGLSALQNSPVQSGNNEATIGKIKSLLALVDNFVRRSVWIVGGDGWAYDIGSGGLDHVLASGRNVNVLVLDTEVYSNTGGQMSKSTPLGAVAKFASAGKSVAKKDLALQAIAYGNVYVARVAMGANPQQTLLAFREAEAYDGPSLILAYSHCIAHGIDMQKGLQQQDSAVASGYWPLIRYNPALRMTGRNPFVLESLRPRIPLKEYAQRELRYRILKQTHPEDYEKLMGMAQLVVNQKWKTYEDMATLDGSQFHPDARMPT